MIFDCGALLSFDSIGWLSPVSCPHASQNFCPVPTARLHPEQLSRRRSALEWPNGLRFPFCIVFGLCLTSGRLVCYLQQADLGRALLCLPMRTCFDSGLRGRALTPVL